MTLLELTDSEIATGYYDPTEDKLNRREKTDTRKPKITLRHLNRLRRMRALKRLEDLKREDLFAIMYAAPEEGAGGPGGMSPF